MAKLPVIGFIHTPERVGFRLASAVTSDMESAWFDGGRIHIEGRAVGDSKSPDVTVSLTPEDSPDCGNAISSTDGEVTPQIISEFAAELDGVETTDSKSL